MRRNPSDELSASDFNPENILLRAKRLDRNALDSLYHHTYPEIYRYIRYRIDDPKVCEDLSGEVFLRFLETINHRQAPRHNLTGWLFDKADELVREHLQQQKEKPSQAKGRRENTTSQVDTSQTNEWSELSRRFRLALSQISPEQQHFLALRFSIPRSLEQVAQIMGISQTKIRWQQFLALNALLGALGGKPVRHKDESLVRALQVCIQNLLAGGKPGELALAFPKWPGALRALLEVARFSAALASNERMGWLVSELEIAQSHSHEEFTQVAQRMIPKRSRPKLGRILLVTSITFVLMGLSSFAMAGLSSRAIPGDLFYPTKLAIDQIRLRLATGASNLIQLESQFNQRRLQEVQEMQRLGRTGMVDFTASLNQIQEGEWTIGGLQVIVPPQAQILGSIYTGYDITVSGEIDATGDIIARHLQMREFLFEGRLNSMSSESWLVGDIAVVITPETILIGTPETGKRVSISAFIASENRLHARLVEVLE